MTMGSEPRPNPLVQLTLARWRSFYRDPGVLFWTVGFPILLAIVLAVLQQAGIMFGLPAPPLILILRMDQPQLSAQKSFAPVRPRFAAVFPLAL